MDRIVHTGEVIMANEFVLFEREFAQVEDVLRRFQQQASAKAVLLINANGQQIAAAGEIEQFDTTSVASLMAANVAAADDLAKLISEREFSVLREGQRDNIHISIVAKIAILLVIFDDRSSLGLVRLGVKRSRVELEPILEAMQAKAAQSQIRAFTEITDQKIGVLFGQ